MDFQRPFLKLPIQFDAAAIEKEMRALPPEAWDPHPTGFVGNEAVKLVSPDGLLTDSPDGPMGPTIYLEQCEYVRQLMGTLGAVWGRSRFMGLAPGREVPSHVDIHYYWRTHLRIHIPVVTNPGVLFTCGTETVHMAAGECWLFDSFRIHEVQNKGDQQRVHLVIDTVGGGMMPRLIAAAQAGQTVGPMLAPGSTPLRPLSFEQHNTPEVMSPWEMRCHTAFLRSRSKPHPALPQVMARMYQFIDAWAAVWALHGTSRLGFPMYKQLVGEVRADLKRMGSESILLVNEISLHFALEAFMLAMAFGRLSDVLSSREEGDRTQRLAS